MRFRRYLLFWAAIVVPAWGQYANVPSAAAAVINAPGPPAFWELQEPAPGLYRLLIRAGTQALPKGASGTTIKQVHRLLVPLQGSPIEVRSVDGSGTQVSLGAVGVFRGLSMTTVEYTLPTTGPGEILEFEIRTAPAAGGKPTRLSPATLRALSQVTGNPGFVQSLDFSWQDRDLLLIIYPDSLAGKLAPLISWKRSSGLEVIPAPLSSAGVTAAAIKAYIQDAYLHWERPPTFVLLVGDTLHIPAWYGTRYPDPSAQKDYPTDLYYGTMDGTDDYIPEVFIGRLPARTAADLTGMVEKILDHERPGGIYDALINPGVFVATRDPSFHQLVESTHRYAIDTHYSPAGLAADSIWGYSGSVPADIGAALDEGTRLLCYSGHGSEYTWWATGDSFDSRHIDGLDVSAAIPLVLSFGCAAGTFGGGSPSLGESFILAGSRGAVGFWGASRLAYWYEDDYLERRFFDALFSGQLYSVGEMTWAALMAVWQRGYPTGDYYFEIYNLLGDPSLAFTVKPLEFLSVAYQDTVPAGMTSLTLEVAGGLGPVFDGWASVTDSDTIIAQAPVSGGMAELRFDQPLPAGTAMEVTVTAPRHVPFTGRLVVLAAPTTEVVPSAIPINQTNTVTVTLSSLPPNQAAGNVLTITGLGVPPGLTAVTDAAGSANLALLPVFGETLRLTVTDTAGGLLYEGTLPVTGGLDLSVDSLVAGSTLLGTTDFLVPGFPGDVTWSADQAGTRLFLQGSGIDTSTAETTISLTPVFEGLITAALADTGYNLSIFSIPVHSTTGVWEGLVVAADSRQPLAGLEFDLLAMAGEPRRTYPLSTGGQGAFTLAEELPVGYYSYQLWRFGYHNLADTILIRMGSNLDTLAMTPMEPATVTGTITAAGEPLAGAVIWARGRDLRDTTLTYGEFGLNMVPGKIRFTIYHPGYQLLDTVLTLAEGESRTGLEFALNPGPAEWEFTFEDDAEGFTLSGDWAWGSPGIGLHRRGPVAAFDGERVMGTVLDGDYRPYTNSSLITPALSLDGFEHATLTFHHYYRFTSQTGFDGGNIKVFTDGGSSWDVIDPVGGYPVAAMFDGSAIASQPAFSGSQGHWERVQVSLDQYIGQSIAVRFHMASTNAVEDDGWYIDQVLLLNETPRGLAAAGPVLPTRAALHQNYPNPFNPGCTLSFDLPLAAPAKLVVYDLRGREVRTLLNQRLAAGSHQSYWDGRDGRGGAVGAGVYLAVLVTPSHSDRIKMVLLK